MLFPEMGEVREATNFVREGDPKDIKEVGRFQLKMTVNMGAINKGKIGWGKM